MYVCMYVHKWSYRNGLRKLFAIILLCYSTMRSLTSLFLIRLPICIDYYHKFNSTEVQIVAYF